MHLNYTLIVPIETDNYNINVKMTVQKKNDSEKNGWKPFKQCCILCFVFLRIVDKVKVKFSL